MLEKLIGLRRSAANATVDDRPVVKDSPSLRAGDAYARLIAETLNEERSRKQSIEQRGANVITSSAAIAGALLGLAAISPSATFDSLPTNGLILVATGFIGLGAAAVLALLSSWPFAYEELDHDELRRLLEPNFWDARGSVGERRAAEVRIDVIANARVQNGRKAILLTLAMGIQILAVIALVAGAGLTLVLEPA